MNIRPHTLTFLFVLLLAPFHLYARETPKVSVATAVQGQWQPRHAAFGRVSPVRDSVMIAPFKARVTAVEVDVGETVRRGQTLARLRSPKLRALLDRALNAREEVGLARRRADTLARGLREKAVTRSSELEAEIGLGRARGRLSEAWQALDDALLSLGQQPDHAAVTGALEKSSAADLAVRLGVVRAPFDAVVVERRIAPGQQPSSGTPMFTVEDLSRVYIEVGVPRKELSDWRGGAAAAAAPDGPRALTALPSRPRLDPASGLWLLLFITDNPGLHLQDGDWVRVNLSGPERTAIWLPESSVVARSGQTYCILERDGKLVPVAVTAGPAEKGRIPVLSGLKEGDRVVTEGAYELLYRDLKDLMKFVD